MVDAQERAFFYSPLSFVRDARNVLSQAALDALHDAESFHDREGACEIRIRFRKLDWDSDFFHVPTWRIDFIEWTAGTDADIQQSIAGAVTRLCKTLAERHGRFYCFAEIPSEDVRVLQGLGLAGLRLIETRLTYFRNDVAAFQWEQRAAVRAATEADIPNLREAACVARNDYDRFHADPFFGEQVADEFLAVFAQNSVRGFASIVMVPADDLPPNAFLTADLMPAYTKLLGRGVGRMVLSAVAGPRRGWYLKLIAEMSYWMQAQGVDLCYMTTQSTNRAVVRVWETLGYRFGRSTHILALHG